MRQLLPIILKSSDALFPRYRFDHWSWKEQRACKLWVSRMPVAMVSLSSSALLLRPLPVARLERKGRNDNLIHHGHSPRAYDRPS